MLLPKKINQKIAPFGYMLVCSLHGFLYGVLYAPAQAIFYGLSMEGMFAWIIAGFPFDFIHGVSNFFCGVLIVPIVSTLKLAERAIKANTI